MQSKATTVAAYLAEIPVDRRAALERVRDVIRKNVDKNIEEGMTYGMIGYYVPHRVFPAGYHCDPKQPLPYAGLASQKNHMSLYLMSVYCGCFDGGTPGPDGGDNAHASWFKTAWAKTGKKLDMGKACIRFKKVEDLALDVIAEAFRRVSTTAFIEHYQSGLASTKASKTAKPAKPATKTSSPKPATPKTGKKAYKKTAKKAGKKTAKKR